MLFIIRKRIAVKAAGASLAAVYFATNVLFAHQAETSFWNARREPKTVQLASRPAASVLPPVTKEPPPSIQSSRGPGGFSLSDSVGAAALSGIPAALSRHFHVRHRHVSAGNLTVYILEDVHANLEAQQRLSQAIRQMGEEPGERAVLVGLEGAAGGFLYDEFKATPAPDLAQWAADVRFDRRELSGPAHAGFTSFPTRRGRGLFFWGVDDRAGYQANVEAYRRASERRGLAEAELDRIGRDLTDRKTRSFNPRLRRLDAVVESYRRGKTGFGAYLDALSSVAPVDVPSIPIETFLSALSLEKTLNLARVEAARGRALEALAARLSEGRAADLAHLGQRCARGEASYADFYRRVQSLFEDAGLSLAAHPPFDDYLRYVLLSDGIDAERLFADAGRLEDAVYQELAATPEEKRLVEESRRLALTRKLIGFALTPGEWEKYQELNPKFEYRNPKQIQIFENGNSNFGNSYLSFVSDFGFRVSDLTSFEDFYRQAVARDSALANNLLGAVRPELDPTAAILVAGGFHTPGVRRILEERGVSYAVLSPKLTTVDTEADPAAALSVFDREKTPLEKLFAGKKLFLAALREGARNPLLSDVPVIGAAQLAGDMLGGAADQGRLYPGLKEWAESMEDLELERTEDDSGGLLLPVGLAVVAAIASAAGGMVVFSAVLPLYILFGLISSLRSPAAFTRRPIPPLVVAFAGLLVTAFAATLHGGSSGWLAPAIAAIGLGAIPEGSYPSKLAFPSRYSISSRFGAFLLAGDLWDEIERSKESGDPIRSVELFIDSDAVRLENGELTRVALFEAFIRVFQAPGLRAVITREGAKVSVRFTFIIPDAPRAPSKGNDPIAPVTERSLVVMHEDDFQRLIEEIVAGIQSLTEVEIFVDGEFRNYLSNIHPDEALGEVTGLLENTKHLFPSLPWAVGLSVSRGKIELRIEGPVETDETIDLRSPGGQQRFVSVIERGLSIPSHLHVVIDGHQGRWHPVDDGEKRADLLSRMRAFLLSIADDSNGWQAKVVMKRRPASDMNTLAVWIHAGDRDQSPAAPIPEYRRHLAERLAGSSLPVFSASVVARVGRPTLENFNLSSPEAPLRLVNFVCDHFVTLSPEVDLLRLIVGDEPPVEWLIRPLPGDLDVPVGTLFMAAATHRHDQARVWLERNVVTVEIVPKEDPSSGASSSSLSPLILSVLFGLAAWGGNGFSLGSLSGPLPLAEVGGVPFTGPGAGFVFPERFGFLAAAARSMVSVNHAGWSDVSLLLAGLLLFSALTYALFRQLTRVVHPAIVSFDLNGELAAADDFFAYAMVLSKNRDVIVRSELTLHGINVPSGGYRMIIPSGDWMAVGNLLKTHLITLRSRKDVWIADVWDNGEAIEISIHPQRRTGGTALPGLLAFFAAGVAFGAWALARASMAPSSDLDLLSAIDFSSVAEFSAGMTGWEFLFASSWVLGLLMARFAGDGGAGKEEEDEPSLSFPSELPIETPWEAYLLAHDLVKEIERVRKGADRIQRIGVESDLALRSPQSFESAAATADSLYQAFLRSYRPPGAHATLTREGGRVLVRFTSFGHLTPSRPALLEVREREIAELIVSERIRVNELEGYYGWLVDKIVEAIERNSHVEIRRNGQVQNHRPGVVPGEARREIRQLLRWTRDRLPDFPWDAILTKTPGRILLDVTDDSAESAPTSGVPSQDRQPKPIDLSDEGSWASIVRVVEEAVRDVLEDGGKANVWVSDGIDVSKMWTILENHPSFTLMQMRDELTAILSTLHEGSAAIEVQKDFVGVRIRRGGHSPAPGLLWIPPLFFLTEIFARFAANDGPSTALAGLGGAVEAIFGAGTASGWELLIAPLLALGILMAGKLKDGDSTFLQAPVPEDELARKIEELQANPWVTRREMGEIVEALIFRDPSRPVEGFLTFRLMQRRSSGQVVVKRAGRRLVFRAGPSKKHGPLTVSFAYDPDVGYSMIVRKLLPEGREEEATFLLTEVLRNFETSANRPSNRTISRKDLSDSSSESELRAWVADLVRRGRVSKTDLERLVTALVERRQRGPIEGYASFRLQSKATYLRIGHRPWRLTLRTGPERRKGPLIVWFVHEPRDGYRVTLEGFLENGQAERSRYGLPELRAALELRRPPRTWHPNQREIESPDAGTANPSPADGRFDTPARPSTLDSTYQSAKRHPWVIAFLRLVFRDRHAPWKEFVSRRYAPFRESRRRVEDGFVNDHFPQNEEEIQQLTNDRRRIFETAVQGRLMGRVSGGALIVLATTFVFAYELLRWEGPAWIPAVLLTAGIVVIFLGYWAGGVLGHMRVNDGIWNRTDEKGDPVERPLTLANEKGENGSGDPVSSPPLEIYDLSGIGASGNSMAASDQVKFIEAQLRAANQRGMLDLRNLRKRSRTINSGA